MCNEPVMGFGPRTNGYRLSYSNQLNRRIRISYMNRRRPRVHTHQLKNDEQGKREKREKTRERDRENKRKLERMRE